MKKLMLIFATLLAITIQTQLANAQSPEVFKDGNVTILQHADGWQVLHGRSIVAHGDGILNVQNLPPAFKTFIDHYSTLPLDQSPRKSLSKSTSLTYGPLIKTHWNQTSPYNDLCPEINGQRCVTGCTTIASAQLMYYYLYCKPLQLSGTHKTWYTDIQSEYITNVDKKDYYAYYDYDYTYTPDFDQISNSTEELARFVVGIAFAQNADFGPYSAVAI